MREWTQEERGKAAAYMARTKDLAAVAYWVADDDPVWEAVMELTCQRNALLEALKIIITRAGMLRHEISRDCSLDNLVGIDAIQGEARAAIAKCEATL